MTAKHRVAAAGQTGEDHGVGGGFGDGNRRGETETTQVIFDFRKERPGNRGREQMKAIQQPHGDGNRLGRLRGQAARSTPEP